jgi:outer membrane protein assembly factor BamB
MGDSRIPELEAVASPPQRELDYYDLQLSEEPLGEGGQTVVYEARAPDPDPPEKVAVRQLGDRGFTKGVEYGDHELFFEQAETWASLSRRERTEPRWRDSDHIVGVVALGDNLPWAALEYMDGGSLAHRLDGTDGLPVEEAVWVGERLCQGLQVAHNTGVAHLDLKPENILFRQTETGTWDVPKIADWGLARNLLDGTSDSMDVLSPRYAAPEQFDRQEFGRPGTATDIYQLGAVLYALLTGSPPYTGTERSVMFDIVSDETPAPSNRRSEISRELDAVVRTALEAQKSDRYDSIAQFKRALRAIRHGRRLPRFFENNYSEANSGQSIAPSKNNQEILSPALVGTETRSQQEGVVCHKRFETQNTDGFRGVVVQFQLGSSRSDSVKCVVTETLPSSVSDVYAIGDSSGTWIHANTEGEVRFETTLSPDEALTAAYGIPATSIDRPALVTGEPQLSVRTTPSQTQWRMFGCGPTRKGAPAGHTGPDAPVTTRWQFDTDGRVYSSPVVVDGTVYVGSHDHSLYAVDAVSGEKQWQFNTSGKVYSSPAVVDGIVYVGSDDHNLYAVDAVSGEKQWQFNTSRSVKSSPVVVDDTVYVGSDDHSLYAVDAATGNQEWRFNTSGGVESSPAVADGTVYVGTKYYSSMSNSGSLYAVDAATGNQEWRFNTSGLVKSSPAVVDGTVYVGSDDYSLYAVDAATGNQEWQFDTLAPARSSPAVVDSTVYVGSWDRGLYAVDAVTGNRRWLFVSSGKVYSSPAVVDGTVYVGSEDNLYAVNAVTGDRQWQFDTSGKVGPSPAVVDGTVYVGSNDNDLYAVERES